MIRSSWNFGAHHIEYKLNNKRICRKMFEIIYGLKNNSKSLAKIIADVKNGNYFILDNRGGKH